jgi:O-antigen/teichoic acid export membrane protein
LAQGRPVVRLIYSAKILTVCVFAVGMLAAGCGAIIIEKTLPAEDGLRSGYPAWIYLAGCAIVLTSSLGILGKTALALRRGALVYGLSTLGSIASLSTIHLLSRSSHRGNLLLTVAVIQMLPALLSLPLFAIEAKRWKLRYVRKSLVIICYRAVKFGGFVFLSMLVLQVDYLIISSVLTAIDAAEYNVAFRITNFVTSIYITTLSAYWPVVAEHIVRGQLHEAKRVMGGVMKCGLLIAAVAFIGIAWWAEKLYAILHIEHNNSEARLRCLLLSLGLYWILRIWTDTFAVFLQAANRVSVLLWVIPIQAIVSSMLAVGLAQRIGIAGVPLGMALGFALTVAWVLPVKVRGYTSS